MQGSPQAIVANTVKGKGVSILEETPAKWHGKALSQEQSEEALQEIGAT